VVAGIFRFVAALATDDETGATRVLPGVLSFIVGLYALRHILVAIATLALLLGSFWIVNGAIEVFTAWSHRRMPGRGWTIFMGSSAWSPAWWCSSTRPLLAHDALPTLARAHRPSGEEWL
jgi:uncharacterized membrane protein HdeD (DUF308 family)